MVFCRRCGKQFKITTDNYSFDGDIYCDDCIEKIRKRKEVLEQHEEEIRKQERQQVIAELREWAKQTKVNVGIDIIDYECFKQKLEEMKGE